MGIKEEIQKWKSENPIRVFRKESNFSQPELAMLMDVSVYTIQRWEDGSVNPSVDNVNKLGNVIKGFEQQWEEWKRNRPSL